MEAWPKKRRAKVESALRTRVNKALSSIGAFAVENMCGSGTPDVATTIGWIELKQIPHFPKRGGIVRIPHFTTEQRAWHNIWNAKGGKSYILLYVVDPGSYYLFRGGNNENIGNVAEQQLNLDALIISSSFNEFIQSVLHYVS